MFTLEEKLGYRFKNRALLEKTEHALHQHSMITISAQAIAGCRLFFTFSAMRLLL